MLGKSILRLGRRSVTQVPIEIELLNKILDWKKVSLKPTATVTVSEDNFLVAVKIILAVQIIHTVDFGK